MGSPVMVKENVLSRGPLATRWVAAGAAASLLALCGVALVDLALPAPLHRGAPPDRFIADIAYEHLVNLTSIGPRVAGSYANEVLAVNVLLAAVRDIARGAAPHHAVDVDLHTASGAFSLDFFDGLNNVYRSVQSVVVRVRGAGGAAAAAGAQRGSRTALLLNCHFDTVPDSPGASDDGAGCAVLLETLRALVASPAALRHDALFLLNGAEENIMQASHAFITQHKWAKTVRAFINIEACGSGGREVLFQAGPHDPWIMEVYAGAVPHPFASSLAQELFESGLIPADTDFRIFRDFGKLSGVDLAWNANGYVYHTALDTADRVPRESLQRTGDNVLALTRGLLASDRLESARDATARQPVFFDVVGLLVVVARPPAAALAALLTLALVALRLHCAATDARKHLYISRRAWWRQVAGAAAGTAAALLAGLVCSAAPALLLHLAGSRLVYYSDNLLLAPLFALPGVCGAWSAARVWSRWQARAGAGAGALVRGWWAARAWADAGAALWGAALALCLARAVRSGFVALLWALLPSLADLAASACAAAGLTAVKGAGGARAWWWAAGAALPALQTWYLALGWVHMFVPLLGRAGTGPPPDLAAAAFVCCLTLAATSWLLPLVVAARSVRRLVYAGALVSLATLVLVQSTALGAPYSAARPQRFMLFHVRRTVHPLPAASARGDVTADLLYWLPELDANTPHSVDMYVAGMSEAQATSSEMCSRHPYCGAPYFLPVQGLVARGYELRAGAGAGVVAAGPRARLHARLALRAHALNDTVQVLTADLTGPSHIVLIVAVAAGARVSWCGALDGAPREARRRWEGRRTYFFTLHDARGEAPKHWHFDMHIEHSFSSAPAQWAWVSAAAHAQAAGAGEEAPEHAALRRAFPAWSHVSGWGIDLHLYDI